MKLPSKRTPIRSPNAWVVLHPQNLAHIWGEYEDAWTYVSAMSDWRASPTSKPIGPPGKECKVNWVNIHNHFVQSILTWQSPSLTLNTRPYTITCCMFSLFYNLHKFRIWSQVWVYALIKAKRKNIGSWNKWRRRKSLTTHLAIRTRGRPHDRYCARSMDSHATIRMHIELYINEKLAYGLIGVPPTCLLTNT